MPESDYISQPTLPQVHIWSRLQKGEDSFSTWFGILILYLNHIVLYSPASKVPPHLFKSSNSEVFKELDSSYKWVHSLFTVLISLTIFALIGRENKTWKITSQIYPLLAFLSRLGALNKCWLQESTPRSSLKRVSTSSLSLGESTGNLHGRSGK